MNNPAGYGSLSSPPPPPPPPKSGGFSPQQSHHPSSVQHPSFAASATSPQQVYPPTGPPVPPQPHQQAYTGPQSPPPLHPQSTGPGPAPAPSSGEQWLPQILRDKSKADLETIRNSPALLSALLTAPSTAHASLAASQEPLQAQLDANLSLATQLLALEAQIQNVRSSLTPSLLRVAALERQFRTKQEAMDDALAPWAPKAVHARLGQAVQEQQAWCTAMEDSFLDATDSINPGTGSRGYSGTSAEGAGGASSVAAAAAAAAAASSGMGGGGGGASDREVSEWLKKYREGRKLLELRKEKKLRLEEGRVGGWK